MPRNPLYSQYLDFAPTFNWGGETYGEGDRRRFERKIGRKRYSRWARNHPAASRVFDPVEQQMYGAYQPELSAIDRERKLRQDYYGRLMKNLGGFTAALGPMLSGIPGQVTETGRQSANTMTAGGEGFGSVLNADQAANAAAANALLGDINSPAQLAGGDAGGVLAGAAGWIPSTLMQEEAAAWADRARNFPKEAALQANLMMRDLLNDAKADDSEFSGKITDVLSGMAGDRSKLRQDQRDRKLAARDAQREWYLKMAALEMSRGNAARADHYLKLAQQRETRYRAKDKGLAPDGSLLPGYHRGPKGQVVKDGWHIGKNGKPVKDSGRADGKYKPAEVRADMSNDVEDFFDEVDHVDPMKPYLPPTKVKQPWEYKKAFATLWAKYKGTMPANRLRRVINEILAAQGIKKNSKKYPAGVGVDHSHDVPRP